MFGCCNANGAGGLVAKVAQCCKLGLDLLKSRAKALHQSLARLRRRHPSCCAGKEPYAEPRLKLPHGVAQRRLRDAEFGGGFGEALLARHGEEREKVIQMSALHSWLVLISSCLL